MKHAVLILGLLVLTSGLPVVAQGDNPQKTEPGMQCPMMAMMSKTPGGQTTGKIDDMMKTMSQRMAAMYTLSTEELGAVLAENQGPLGLSDVHVQQIAELVASSQQQKMTKQMAGMKGRLTSGGTGCPCCGSG